MIAFRAYVSFDLCKYFFSNTFADTDTVALPKPDERLGEVDPYGYSTVEIPVQYCTVLRTFIKYSTSMHKVLYLVHTCR